MSTKASSTTHLDIELRSCADVVIREEASGLFTLEVGAGCEVLAPDEMEEVARAFVRLADEKGWGR